MRYRSTILIPVYDQHKPYLLAAVQSAMSQSEPTQVVVIDDGSDEPVEAILASVPQWLGTGRLKCITKDNGGVASALNAGLDESSGEYIQWLSSDDVFCADKTKLQASQLVASGNMVCYCAYEEGLPQPGRTWCAAQYPDLTSLYGVLKEHCFINACTVMWHRKVFDEVGQFDVNMRHAQDYEFLLRCAERWNFDAVNVPLVRRRVHSGQMINTLKRPEEAECKRKELEYLRERYGATAQVWVPS